MLWVWRLSVSDADLRSSVCVPELAGAQDSKPCSFSTILEEDVSAQAWGLTQEGQIPLFFPLQKNWSYWEEVLASQVPGWFAVERRCWGRVFSSFHVAHSFSLVPGILSVPWPLPHA